MRKSSKTLEKLGYGSKLTHQKYPKEEILLFPSGKTTLWGKQEKQNTKEENWGKTRTP